MSSNPVGKSASVEVMNYREALFESMEQALALSDNTVIFGQGADDFKGTFGTTLGLPERYGRHRVQDTPLSEEGMTGICIGAALNGLKPIHIHIRADFIFVAMNQIVNMAAKYKYMFGGHYDVPIFIRAVIGRSWGQGGQHSQSPQSVFAHFPGIKVLMPATPQAILESYHHAIHHFNSPVLSLEHRLLYEINFEVDRGNLRRGDEAFSSYRLREGSDLTIVASSIMVLEAVRAAKYLESFGVECEIIDLHSATDIDQDLIINSVTKTGRLLVADTSWQPFGVAAEISRIICQFNPAILRRPIASLGMAPTPCPTAKALEDMFYPNQETFIQVVADLLGRDDISAPHEKSMADVYKKFRGPF